MTEKLWSELESLSATLERLRRELNRCQGASQYKKDLEDEIASAQQRREQLVAELQKTV